MAHTLSSISCDTDQWDTRVEVWNFHVGGYQVCHKWLKDRKGRVLSFEDIQHYQRVVAALAETIELMGQIDVAIDEHGGWPVE
ncbi:MAG TPA: type ISP restriction/modification enzyme [Ktedonobacteraceae bacterium]